MKIKPFKVDKDDLKKYLESTGARKCPRCGGFIFYSDCVHDDIETVIMHYTCKLCDMTVRDIFDRSGVDVRPEKKDPTIEC